MEYTKLLPEIREMIAAEREEFPHLIAAIIEDIEQAEVVSDLKVRNAATIIGYYNTLGRERSNNFELNLYAAFGKY